MDRAGFSAMHAGSASLATGDTVELQDIPRAQVPCDASAYARKSPVYAALDLGTNNCRLLIARQPPPGVDANGFRIVDSFCRIDRLGEGVAQTGRLAEAAMTR